jgi:hypothetical protein
MNVKIIQEGKGKRREPKKGDTSLPVVLKGTVGLVNIPISPEP